MVVKIHKQKRQLTKEEEFELFKLVFDKFLWIGTIATLIGIYLLFDKNQEILLGLILTLVGGLFFTLITSIVSKNLAFKKY
ncbi:hypothetical protein K9L97_01970 [Candidatus Woesearchaeota archaeon]|nr:hypothetical protein [Candidatus Woesearchaeota archaeon]